MISYICYPLLTIALCLAAWRLFRGPTAADRILAIDLLAVITASAGLMHGIHSEEPVYLDVVLVLGVIVFFGTVALARTLLRAN